jgi:hypothetical protein
MLVDIFVIYPLLFYLPILMPADCVNALLMAFQKHYAPTGSQIYLELKNEMANYSIFSECLVSFLGMKEYKEKKTILPFVNEKKKGSDLSVIHYPKLVHSSPNL